MLLTHLKSLWIVKHVGESFPCFECWQSIVGMLWLNLKLRGNVMQNSNVILVLLHLALHQGT